MKAKAFSFTHRTKVFADGTVPNNSASPQEDWQGLRMAPESADQSAPKARPGTSG
jgi:hypothetical protein